MAEKQTQAAQGGKGDDKFKQTFTPRAADPKAAKSASASGKPKKQMSTAAVAIITLLVMALLVGGAGAGLYVIGVLDPSLPLVGIAPRAEKVSFEQRQELLAQKEADFAVQVTELDAREAALDEREAKLNAKDEELAAREAALISFTDVMKNTSEERMAALKKVSALCSEMEADKAVGIIEKMTNLDEVALVLYFMSETKAAQVLELLPNATAAKVLTLIMK